VESFPWRKFLLLYVAVQCWSFGIKFVHYIFCGIEYWHRRATSLRSDVSIWRNKRLLSWHQKCHLVIWNIFSSVACRYQKDNQMGVYVHIYAHMQTCPRITWLFQPMRAPGLFPHTVLSCNAPHFIYWIRCYINRFLASLLTFFLTYLLPVHLLP